MKGGFAMKTILIKDIPEAQAAGIAEAFACGTADPEQASKMAALFVKKYNKRQAKRLAPGQDKKPR